MLAVLSTAVGLNAQVYHNLAASNFSDVFADIATRSAPTSGSWSGFTATTTPPATGLPDANKTTASSVAFASGTGGGIQKGTTQTVATQSLVFLSTGTADNSTSVGLDLLLNFTGRNAGTLSFDAASIDNGTTGTRQGTLNVFASTDGVTWGALSAASLPFVATNLSPTAASISVVLPSSFNEQPQARLRFYYHNGPGGTAGSRPKISIDNVLVTSTPSVVGLPEITSPLTASATAGEPFSYTITANGSPSSYSVASLPPGLSVDSSTGVISGSPTLAGSYSLTLSATNGVGSGSALLQLTVAVNPNAPVVTDASVTATVGTPFTYQIVATNSPASYSSAALPAGLSLDTATGVISGTPTVGGAFTGIQIVATNLFGSDAGALTITIASAPVFNGSFSASCYVGQAFSYRMVASQNPGFYNAQEILEGAVPGLVYDGADLISGAPTVAGDYTFTVVATNTLGSDTKQFTLKVIDPAAQSAIPTTVVVNKLVNSTPDKIELLVVGSGVAGSTVDMRGMIIKDFSSSLDTDSGGKFAFTSNSLWSAVPAGTLIVLSVGAIESQDESVSDFVLRINLGNETYFTSLKIEAPGNSSAFDLATNEMLMIKPAGYGALGVAGGMHAFGTGVPATLPTSGYSQWKAFTGNKLSSVGSSGTNAGAFANNTTSLLADYSGADATGAVASASLLFGSANNTTNQTYIDSLRVTVVPPSLIEEWLVEYFGTSEDTAELLIGATEDFDGDGLSNLLEYAFNTDPTEAGASPVVTVRDGNFLELSYPRITDPALTYKVLGGSDLTVSFGETTGTTETVAGVSTYTDNVDLSTPGVRRFLRVEVTYTE